MYNPFLVGEHIYLRPVQASDAPVVARFLNDHAVRRNLLANRPLSPEAEAEILQRLTRSDGDVLLGIAHKQLDQQGPVGQLIGITGLHGIDSVHRRATFGIFIGEQEMWGRGYGTEATEMLVRYAFETLNLHRVQLEVHSDNERAIRAYERVGFVRDGLLREHYWRDGKWVDAVVMSVLAREFVAKQR